MRTNDNYEVDINEYDATALYFAKSDINKADILQFREDKKAFEEFQETYKERHRSVCRHLGVNPYSYYEEVATMENLLAESLFNKVRDVLNLEEWFEIAKTCMPQEVEGESPKRNQDYMSKVKRACAKHNNNLQLQQELCA